MVWSGEIAAQIPTKTVALVQRRLVAEATTAAWQDYILCNAIFAALAIIPALLVSSRIWRRKAAAEPSTETAAPNT